MTEVRERQIERAYNGAPGDSQKDLIVVPSISMKSRVWLGQPYLYGINARMKKTLNIDDQLFNEAKQACGATTDTDTVRLGLEALVRHAAYERLRALRGSEPHPRDVPRRRERAPKSAQ